MTDVLIFLLGSAAGVAGTLFVQKDKEAKADVAKVEQVATTVVADAKADVAVAVADVKKDIQVAEADVKAVEQKL